MRLADVGMITAMSNKGCYLLSLGLVLVLLLITRFSLERISIEPEGQLERDTQAGEIRGSITIGQTFTAPYDGLCRIDVLMATYARENTEDVIFHLRSNRESESDLVQININGREIEDTQFRSFTFNPIRDSEGKSYYFFFDSPESVPGDAVTVWGTKKDLYAGGRAFRNHRPGQGDLTFLTYYQPSSVDKVRILLDRLAQNKPLFWGDKRFYILLALLYLSLFGLFWVSVAAHVATEKKKGGNGDRDRV